MELIFFFKQKTAYEMRIRDWSSDVCSSDLKKQKLKEIKVMVEDAAAARRLFQKLEKIAEGVFLTRNLVSEPANVLFPKSFAAEARKLEKLGDRKSVV